MTRQDRNISGIKNSLAFPNKRVLRWVSNLHIFQMLLEVLRIQWTRRCEWRRQLTDVKSSCEYLE